MLHATSTSTVARCPMLSVDDTANYCAYKGKLVAVDSFEMLSWTLFLLNYFSWLTLSSAADSCPAPPPKYVFAPNSCIDNDGCSAEHCDCGYPRLEQVTLYMH